MLPRLSRFVLQKLAGRGARHPDEEPPVFHPVGIGENFSDGVVMAGANFAARVVLACGWVLGWPPPASRLKHPATVMPSMLTLSGRKDRRLDVLDAHALRGRGEGFLHISGQRPSR